MPIDTTDDTAASGNSAPGLDLAVIDASTTAPQPLAFIAPDSSSMASDAARPFGRPGGGGTMRVSTNTAGNQANGASHDPAVSGNGRYLAFESDASNLVPGDANGAEDVFVKDLRTGKVTLASADAQGNGGNSYSTSSPSISANGRYVAFDSGSSNLVPGDANGTEDIFVKDLRTGAIVLASADAKGNGGNGPSFGAPSLSANGRTVAFESNASNLAPGDANGTTDIFVKDLRTGAVTLASADAAGNAGNSSSSEPSLSADGRFVAFTSNASNLLPGSASGQYDVFVKDLRTGAVVLASADAGGAEANSLSFSDHLALSADGRFVAFSSSATNLTPGQANGTEDVFVKDLRTGTVVLASADAGGNEGNAISTYAAISPNGRYVSFSSSASNLVAEDINGTGDVFVKDLWTGGITKLTANVPVTGHYDNGYGSSYATDTGAVAFDSRSANLVPGDTNGVSDVFLST